MTRRLVVGIAIVIACIIGMAARFDPPLWRVQTIDTYPVEVLPPPPAELVPEPADPFEQHRRYQEDVLRQLDEIERDALEIQRAVREMGERQTEEDEILLRIEQRMDELERRR